MDRTARREPNRARQEAIRYPSRTEPARRSRSIQTPAPMPRPNEALCDLVETMPIDSNHCQIGAGRSRAQGIEGHCCPTISSESMEAPQKSTLQETARQLDERIRALRPQSLLDRSIRWITGKHADEQQVGLIRAMASICGRHALGYCCGYLAFNSIPVRAAASEEIRRVLGQTRTVDLPAIECMVSGSWLRTYEWMQLRPSDLDKILYSVTDRMAVLAIATFHCSGYVREAAVSNFAAQSHDGWELPFLLMRCCDWVREVSEAAEAAVRARLLERNISHFARSSALILRLRERERGAESDALRSTLSLLHSSAAVPELESLIEHKEISLRRAAFEIASGAGPFSPHDLVSRAMRSYDPELRRRGLLFATQHFERDELFEFLSKVLRTMHGAPAYQALTEMAQRWPEHAAQFVEQAIWSRTRTVRRLAREWAAVNNSHVRPADEYRRVIAANEPKRLASALEGLGECGSSSDVNVVSPFLDSPSVKLRTAAANAYCLLIGTQDDVRIVELLGDAASSVSRVAYSALRGRSLHPAILRLRELSKSPHAHVRKRAGRLVASVRHWLSFEVLACLYRDQDPAVSTSAREALRRWISNAQPVQGCAQDRSAAENVHGAIRMDLSKDENRTLDLMFRVAGEMG